MICIEKGNEKLILTKDSNLIENFCFIFHSILFIKRNLLFRKAIYEKKFICMNELCYLKKSKNYIWCVSKIYMWYLCCFCICLFNCIINGIELNRLWNFFRVFDLTHHSQNFFFTIWNIAKIFLRESNKYTNTNVTTKKWFVW